MIHFSRLQIFNVRHNEQFSAICGLYERQSYFYIFEEKSAFQYN